MLTVTLTPTQLACRWTCSQFPRLNPLHIAYFFQLALLSEHKFVYFQKSMRWFLVVALNINVLNNFKFSLYSLGWVWGGRSKNRLHERTTAQRPHSSLDVHRVRLAGWWPLWPGPGPKHHASVKYDLPLSQIDSRLVVVLHQRKILLQ